MLEALAHFFLWCYAQTVQRDYGLVATIFPLFASSRVDLVHVVPSGRVHFLFRSGDDGRHRFFLHALTLSPSDGGPEAEKQCVAHRFGAKDIVVHFVLDPPFQQRFDEVGQVAEALALRHARTPLG